MAKITFNPAKDIPALKDKVFLVTGGTAGLGAGCISALAQHNPSHIFFTGRNTAKANAAISKIHKTSPSVPLTFLECDNKSLSSVQSCAQRFAAASARLDVLICNAGIMAVDAATTIDGYEVQFQVNHLSHALLIKLLLPIMLKTAELPHSDVRIVNMSSVSYTQAPKSGIDFLTLRSNQSNLGPMIPGSKWTRYGQSKLANMLYPGEIAKHYPQLLSVSVHPGIILTDLFAGVSFGARLPALISSMGKRTPIEQGPWSMLWVATSARGGIQNGAYYEPVGVLGVGKTAQSRDEKLAETLWAWTQKELEGFE